MVSILEEPRTLASRFVVFEVALEVQAVGIDPLSVRQFRIHPVAAHLHAGLLEDISSVAVLLSVLPPTGVDISVFVSKDALAVTATPLPVTVVLSNVVVGHLSDTVFSIGRPITLVLVSRLVISIRATAVSSSIKEVTLKDVSIVIGCRSIAGKAPRARLEFIILSSQLILTFFSSL